MHHLLTFIPKQHEMSMISSRIKNGHFWFYKEIHISKSKDSGNAMFLV